MFSKKKTRFPKFPKNSFPRNHTSQDHQTFKKQSIYHAFKYQHFQRNKKQFPEFQEESFLQIHLTQPPNTEKKTCIFLKRNCQKNPKNKKKSQIPRRIHFDKSTPPRASKHSGENDSFSSY